jgi:manganese/zinc/iron transport system substrate-binding protein
MNFYISILCSIYVFLISHFLFGCARERDARSDTDESAEPYKIVCTVGMITDIVGNLAGDYAEVEGIIGEGIDPHLYKPTRGDVIKLNQADVVFYNGLLLEGRMTDVLISVASKGKLVKAVTEAILEETDYLLEKDDGSAYTDPHVWMDVSGWLRAIAVVAETLAAYDPENAESYRSKATVYADQLEALDAYAKVAISTIPKSQRVLVTAHDAFQYLGRAYSIEVRGIQGMSTESEAGVRDLEDLVDFIVERQIPAVKNTYIIQALKDTKQIFTRGQEMM